MEAKFAVGDRVAHSSPDRFVGTVKAVYQTKDGEVRYAIDMKGYGTLRLCSEPTNVIHGDDPVKAADKWINSGLKPPSI